MSILEISKTVTYGFWYGYINPKYQDKENLCYMDRDSFILNKTTENVHKDIANDSEKRSLKFIKTRLEEVSFPIASC